jgi:hypothetical protein
VVEPIYDGVAGQNTGLLPLLKESCEIPVMLRRLRHIDARELKMEEVAERLTSPAIS